MVQSTKTYIAHEEHEGHKEKQVRKIASRKGAKKSIFWVKVKILKKTQ